MSMKWWSTTLIVLRFEMLVIRLLLLYVLFYSLVYCFMNNVFMNPLDLAWYKNIWDVCYYYVHFINYFFLDKKVIKKWRLQFWTVNLHFASLKCLNHSFQSVNIFTFHLTDWHSSANFYARLLLLIFSVY